VLDHLFRLANLCHHGLGLGHELFNPGHGLRGRLFPDATDVYLLSNDLSTRKRTRKCVKNLLWDTEVY
jgi:hypothetical protein